jgi:hypothetical protein
MKTRIMRNFILTTALVSACFLTACGGGSSVSSPVPTTATAPTTANQNKATANSSITFAIPLGIKFSGAPSQSLSSRPAQPQFIDASTNGAFTIVFDSSTMLNAIPFQPNGTVTEGEAGPSGSGTLPNGGSFNYSVTYTFTNSQGSGSGNQPYADVSFAYTTTPGSHALGVVETDGPCDQGGPCISNTNGYVLTNGQATLNLQPGTNNASTLVLKGVMESAYLCDAACDGGAGTYGANGYSITVFVADEAGDAIPYQTDASGNPVPFDNGSYQIIEADSNNIVTITQPGTIYSTPGTADHSLYGENISIACNKVGTTQVEAVLLASDPSSGSVANFTYNANNYPAAGSVLGSVGANEYFGNVLSVNCTASDVVTVE